MELESICIRSLANHMQTISGEEFEILDNYVSIPNMNLCFYAHDIEFTDKKNYFTVTVVFEAKPNTSESGIKVLAIGTGKTIEEAAIDVGHQWGTGVFPVIASYIFQKDIEGVHKNPLVVGVPETKEIFGWTAHIGPVQHRVYGSDIKEFDKGELDPDEAYRPIFDSIHSFAAHKNLLWVESFSAKYPDGKVNATCRMNNKDWEEGEEALLYWAHSWPDTQGHVLSKRQFIIFESKPIECIDQSLIQYLYEQMEQE